MELVSGKGQNFLTIKATTWYKDSHSLFDYESNKISSDVFSFSNETQSVSLYRKRTSCKVIAVNDKLEANIDPEVYQFLTCFEVKNVNSSKIKLCLTNQQKYSLKKINSQRVNTEQSITSSTQKEEDAYLVVRRHQNTQGEAKGYKLWAGQTIKIGRVQFFVSEVFLNGQLTKCKNTKNNLHSNKQIMIEQILSSSVKKACKICLDEEQTEQNRLINPCKCSGSCGTVHTDCLVQWIGIKVKKDVIGGTQQYNFQKFQCEVCKSELPVVIEDKNRRIQLLPITKPEGNYIVLESICQKSKSNIVITNIPEAGIKLGRGHECQIRISDISVSRSHAFIKFINNQFLIFDNKSKFGTLIKEDNIGFQVSSKVRQGVQIGRTVVTFEIAKEKKQSARLMPTFAKNTQLKYAQV